MEKILVATDGSRAATDAVEFAADLAAAHAASLTITFAVPLFDAIPVADEDIAAYPYEPTASDHAVLRDAADRAQRIGVKATTHLLPGPVVDAVISYAETRAVDVIVVGSRGHGAVASAILGSVSLGVLRKAKRPVLIVRGAQVLQDGVDAHR